MSPMMVSPYVFTPPASPTWAAAFGGSASPGATLAWTDISNLQAAM